MGDYGIARMTSHLHIEFLTSRLSRTCRATAGMTDIFIVEKRKPVYPRPVEDLFFFSSLSLRFSFRVCCGFFFCCFLPLSAFPDPAIFNSPFWDRVNYSMASDLREAVAGIVARPSAHSCHISSASSILAMGARGADQTPEVALK
jgi:hypothetical protein